MRLSGLELALGLPIGADAPAALPPGRDPLTALERAVLEPLRRGPCLVSFSGGRDSSAVLAVATRVARREGLPDPIPATLRVPAAPGAEESGWQELLVAHLGLADWLRPEFSTELDLVGPVAAAVLRRHGPLWPFNSHLHVPLLEAARGGTLLTGIGGDELFRSATSPRAAAVLAGRVRPATRDARRVALYLAPRAARERWHRRGELHPWLTTAGDAAARRALARWEAAEPRGLRERMAHVRAARYLGAGTGSLRRLAGDQDAAIAHPLLDPAVWGAVAASAPRGGHLGRTQAMRAVFGDLLPDALLARDDKACFDEVLFSEHSRAFVRRWDGSGVPAGLVDPEALRAHWLAPEPRAQSFALIQHSWSSLDHRGVVDRGQPHETSERKYEPTRTVPR